MLEAENLACLKGDRLLFRGLALRLEAGGLLRIAGPNGVGKTSLLRLACGLALPEAGELRWQGRPIRSVREAYHRALLYLGHAAALNDLLTPLENLRFGLVQQGILADEAALFEALACFGLQGREELPVRSLSQGQRRRVALARLALGEAQTLWILDEPLTALDVSAVELVRARIAEHLGRGGVVVLTSHQDVELSGLRMRRLLLGE